MKIVLGLIIFFSATLPAMADDSTFVEKLIKTKMDAALIIMAKKSLAPEVRDNKILALVGPLFDFSQMAKLTLGRKYWPKLSKSQKGEFTDIFTIRLKESYLDKLSIYSDEKPHYMPSTRKKNKIQVLVNLVSDANTISLLYKLYKTRKKEWLIYDVEVQGVSLIATYRSQFDQILRKGSVSDLLGKLKGEGKI